MNDKVAGTMLVTGSGTAVGGGSWLLWLAENHHAIASLGVIVGSACAVLGLLVTIYYKHKASKRRADWLD